MSGFIIALGLAALILIFIIVYFAFFSKSADSPKQNYKIKNEEWHIPFSKAYREMTQQEQITRDKCPKFSKKGYKVGKLSPTLKKRLLDLWNTKNHLKTPEEVPHNVIWGTKTSGKELINHLDISKHDPVLEKDLENYVKDQLMKWANTEQLIHTATYGIREYKRGSTLKVHCDRYDTHVLSAILHIKHEQEEPWSLSVWDHDNNKEEVYLNDNQDLVLYESVSVMHGRPNPFRGDSYVNIFIHFTLPNWKEDMDKLLGK